MHLAVLKALLSRLSVYWNIAAQIAFLFIKKVTILDKYLHFADVFLEKKVMVLPEQIKF